MLVEQLQRGPNLEKTMPGVCKHIGEVPCRTLPSALAMLGESF